MRIIIPDGTGKSADGAYIVDDVEIELRDGTRLNLAEMHLSSGHKLEVTVPGRRITMTPRVTNTIEIGTDPL